jgi:deazaflavin-dependent oxidoreductase (nitroreductase family)
MNAITRKGLQAGVAANIWLYRRTNGRLGGRGMGRLPLLLLTAAGRTSGTLWTVPVAYFDTDAGYVIVGTGFGGSRHVPQWFLNLRAAGHAHVRIGGREYDADAHVAIGAERDDLWAKVAARAPHFASWQARTGRTFPIIVLTDPR